MSLSATPFVPGSAGLGIGPGSRIGDSAGSRYDTQTILFCYIFCVAPLGQHSDSLPNLFCYIFCVAPLRGYSNILPTLFTAFGVRRFSAAIVSISEVTVNPQMFCQIYSVTFSALPRFRNTRTFCQIYSVTFSALSRLCDTWTLCRVPCPRLCVGMRPKSSSGGSCMSKAVDMAPCDPGTF